MRKIYCIILFVFYFLSAKAQWNNDTLVRNIICNRPSNQYQPRICSDGNNGAIICWTDLSFTPSRIYAQRIDSLGFIKWTTNGVLINDTTGSIFNATDPTIARDSTGGAIIAYTQGQLGGLTNLYAIRIDSNGNRVWPQPVAVDAGNDARNPEIRSDINNGTIICWYRYNGGTSVHDYIQWLDGNGNRRMVTNGLQVSFGNTAHYDCHAAFASSIYGYVVYHDDDTLRLQCFDTSGTLLWANPLILTTTLYTTVPYYHLVRSNSNIIVAWVDNKTVAQPGLFAQKVNTAGIIQWAANGIAVDTSNYSHINFQMCTDGANGTFITYGNNSNYTQRIRGNGLKAFALPVEECTSPVGQNNPYIVPDGTGGAIYCWQDGRGNNGVYAQRIDSTGNLLWRTCGSPVYNANNVGNGNDVRITQRNDGTAIAAFFSSAGTSQEIVAAKVINFPLNTGIENINLSYSNSILQPNPAQNEVLLKIKNVSIKKNNLEIYNSNGCLLKKYVVNDSEFRFGISELPSGIYFIKILNDTTTEILKLVKL